MIACTFCGEEIPIVWAEMHEYHCKKRKEEVVENSFDGEKKPYELLPAKAIDEVVQVLAFGKKKYGANNWMMRDSKEDKQAFMGAALRHIFAWQQGDDVDKETGIDHLAHAACNLLFIQELKYIIHEREKTNGDKEDN